MNACRTIAGVGLALGALALSLHAAEGRRTMSLDGRWDIEEGYLGQPPARYQHSVRVPGLADLAEPVFPQVGVTNHWREAFWYRRSVHITGPVPEVALLKVSKAAYGTRVMLNGVLVGDHCSSFTPGYFDLRPWLRGHGRNNELLIRVGATRGAVPPRCPTGYDLEKSQYIPGIFDSVELILSGSPHIQSVQCAPSLGENAVRVQLVTTNAGPEKQEELTLTVREAKTGRTVGTAKTGVQTWGAGTSQTLEAKVTLSPCRWWSPEDPFLYELEVRGKADSTRVVFGMRELRFDGATRRAYLNGKPYYLRGGNVTVYRFFEDAQRGDLPWDADWVRRLHRRFRSLNWNALRYCIGFPPEAWYRIADEEGFLIQDEYPLWSLEGVAGGPKREDLAREYAEWLRERWNHPCVVVWDAQNETRSAETGAALNQARALDLSRRPWANGWGAAQAPGDVREAQAYLFSDRDFQLSDLPGVSPVPVGNPEPNRLTNAIVLNGYAWLWLNRDGTPTTLTRELYRRRLGEQATAEERRQFYARQWAALTEFWRTSRSCAGVLHFCGLGYSRTNGQTCDNFLDVKRLELEPEFAARAREAFSPVGLMLDFWAEDLPGGTTNVFPIVAINDLEPTWKGTVRLRFLRAGRPVAETQAPLQIPGYGRRETALTCLVPQAFGAYEAEAALVSERGPEIRSRREFAVLDPAQQLARNGFTRGKPVTASSFATANGVAFAPEAAVDGRPETRWCSEASDPQWWVVDLGRPETLSRIEIRWAAAYAKAYRLEVSDDALAWRPVYQTETGKGGKEKIPFKPVTARFVRFHGTQRATPSGYSFWEVRVFP